MRVLNIILTLIFLLFAGVQFNDPDPLMWVAIYGIIAIISAFAIFNKYNKEVLILMMVICVAGSIFYFPGLIELVSEHEVSDLTKSMKADTPFIEESRESLGLLIGFFAVLFHYSQSKRHPK